MKNKQNRNHLKKFYQQYWGCLLMILLASGVFLYCLRGELQEYLVYQSAQAQGDLLAMGEMRVNASGTIREDDTIVLLPGGIMYGPYFDYKAGSYILDVFFSYTEEVTDQTVSITSSGGVEQIGSYLLKSGENQIQVDLEEDQDQLEIVLRNESEGEFEIRSLMFYPGTLSD